MRGQMARHDWLQLVRDMLWCFQRETKSTLRSINDEFQHIGLSFDPDFRSQFLNIIVNRVGQTYDAFIRQLEIEQQQHHHQLPIAASTQHSSVASNVRKRKLTDNDDEYQSANGCTDTDTQKRAQTNDNAADATTTAAANTATLVAGTASGTKDDNGAQNRDSLDNLITDDNSGSDHTEQTAQLNGKQRIGSDEAFSRGYVVVIPMRSMDEPEAAGSESGSSTEGFQIPAAPAYAVTIKRETSMETDTEPPTEAALPSPPPLLPPQKPEPTLPPKAIRQNSGLSTAEIFASSSNAQVNDSTPVRRVTRRSSLIATVTPTNLTPARVATITTANGSIAVNHSKSTPKSTKTQMSSAKTPRAKSVAQEPAKTFRCKQCTFATAWKCNFVRHLLVHNDPSIDLESLRCEECPHLIPLVANSLNLPPAKRRATANEPDNLPFACNVCPKKFAENDLLDMHQKAVHRHQCAKCKKKFANGQQADAHGKRCM